MLTRTPTATTVPTKGPAKLEGWNFGHFSRRVSLLQRFTLLQQVKSLATYQPVTLDGKLLRPGDRECAERWRMIESVLTADKIGNLLDLGCAEGFFVRQAALKFGCTALGVDADIRRVTVAQSITLHEGIAGAGYLLSYITPEFVRKLPVFDVVIFCSLLHHIMAGRGVDESRDLLKAVRSRTRQKMIFDMGQSEEVEHEWATFLPPMEPDPPTWISGFLKECGFARVELLGETDGYHKRFRRHLFLAEP